MPYLKMDCTKLQVHKKGLIIKACNQSTKTERAVTTVTDSHRNAYINVIDISPWDGWEFTVALEIIEFNKSQRLVTHRVSA